MPQYLDESAITGKSPEESVASVKGRRYLSETDITGRPEPEPSFLERLSSFVTDPEEQKKFAGTVGKMGLATADMILGIPGQAVGVGANIGARGRALLTGESRRTQEAAGRGAQEMVPEWMTTPLQSIAKSLGMQQPLDQSIVEHILSKAGDKVEKYTKGRLSTQDTKDLFNVVMLAGGAKGVDAGVKMALEPKGKGPSATEARATYNEDAPVESVATILRPGPEAVVIDSPKQVKALFEAAKKNRPPEVSDVAAVDTLFAKARARGVAQIGPKSPYEAIAESKARVAEGKLLEESPKVEGEPLALPPELEPLNVALEKVKAGRAFDLTAEEKISLDHSVKVRDGQLLDHNGRPFERGAMDPDLLKGILLAGGVAAYVATHPEDALTVAMLAGGVLGIKNSFKGAPESVLLEQARSGNQAAFTELYRQNAKQAERTLQSKFGRQNVDIEAALQDGMTSALAAVATGAFRGESKFSTYLHQAVVNKALNQLEAQRVRPDTVSLTEDPTTGRSGLAETLGHNETPANIALNKGLGEQIEAAMAKIDPRFRDAFLAVEAEGLSYDAAAERFQVPVGTIRSRVSRAKEALQGYLREYKDGEVGFDEAIPNRATGRLGGKEGGAIDRELATRLGAVALGAAVGTQVTDNKLLGAVVGGLGLGAATKFKPRAAALVIKSAFAADPRIRINQFADAHEAGIARAARAIWQQATAVAEAAPKLEDRVAITHAIQNGRGIPTHLAAAAQRARDFFGALGEQGQKEGVLKGLIDNYVTNLWDLTGKNKDAWEAIIQRAGGPSMSPESRFALRRRIESIEEGKRLGLEPVTEDVAQIMSIYGNSLARTIENKHLLQALRNVKDPSTGVNLLLPSSKAPHSYGVIDHPQMHGVRVHPDIVPSLKFIFDNSDPGVVMRGLEGLNTAIKRSAVSFSLFHAKALVDAQIGAHGMLRGIPLAAKGLAQAAAPKLFGENAFLKQLREGGAGDLIDQAQSAGLKISMERGKLADEDIGGSFYSALKGVQRGLDSIVPGAGLPIAAVTKINHAVDIFMWERLHAGMKLGTFASKLEVLRNADAKAAVREGRAPRAEAELAAQAASFTNDIYGGLNWRHLAEEAHSKWGRDIALAAYSPKGRRVSQLLLFAPDWTVSTTRAATRAAGKLLGYDEGSGLRGLLEPQNATDLHRQYMLRSATYYLVVGDAINYSLSGHHLWDNADPTMLDMGDGRSMQWSKHSMEPVHWVTKPGQQALNKLGFIPKETANQMLGSEYLSASGYAPRMDTSPAGRVQHVGKSLLPIAAQQAFGEKAAQGGALSGFLGAPIYGKTYTQRYTNKSPEVAARLRARDEAEARDPGLKAARLLRQRERRDRALRAARELR